jgi:hypothetical protein
MKASRLDIDVKVNVKLSLWDAIKLRIAGAEFMRELISRIYEESKEVRQETDV